MSRTSIMVTKVEWGWATVFCCAVGCVSKAATPAAAEFPTLESLEAIAKRPLPQQEAPDVVSVEHWSLPEPSGTPDETQRPWIAHLETAVAAADTRIEVSPALHCTALEVARFHLANGGNPDDRLLRFLAARCGNTTPVVRVVVTPIPVPAEVSDAQIAAEGGPALTRGLQAVSASLGDSSGPPTHLGIAFVRQGAAAALAVAIAPTRATVRSEISDEGTIRVSGEILVDAAFAEGWATRGAASVEPCTPDWSAKFPAFAFECPLDSESPGTWVEFLSAAPQNVLASPFALLYVPRDGQNQDYVANPRAAHPVSDSAELRRALGTAINERRTEAGLTPVLLLEPQSDLNDSVAGHFVAANLEGDVGTSNIIALGLLAGWQVPGIIRTGGILTSHLGATSDAGAWLEFALETPMGRSVLMAPENQSIAIGGALHRPIPGLGVIVTTYSTFEGHDHAADEAQLLGLFQAQREALGLAPAQLAVGADQVTAAAATVTAGTEPKTALNAALRDVGAVSHQPVGGGYWETVDLRLIEFPPELLRLPRVDVAFGVGHRKIPGAAWGQYVVLLVATGPSARQMAIHWDPHRG